MLVKRLAQGHIQFGALVVPVHIIAGNPVLERVKPGRNRSERRTAQGGGHVAAFKQQAASGELVQSRRQDVRVPHEAVVGPCLIVADDHDDVGPVGSGGGRKHQKAEGEEENDELLHGDVFCTRMRMPECQRSPRGDRQQGYGLGFGGDLV